MRSPAALILAAALPPLLTWYVMDTRHDAAVLQLQLDHQTAQTKSAQDYGKALEVARADTLRMQKDKDHAINLANERANANALALAAARGELQRLHSDLSEAKRRIANAPVDALREYADTVSDLYGECEAELTETARAATGHASDVQLMIDAFPKEAR